MLHEFELAFWLIWMQWSKTSMDNKNVPVSWYLLVLSEMKKHGSMIDGFKRNY